MNTRGKEILEQLSKPRFFTEFENRGLFYTAACACCVAAEKKARDFRTP